MTWIESCKSLQLGELVEVPRWHRHPLSGDTNTPRVVPTWAQQRRAESGRFGVVTGHVSVHRHGRSDAPPWAVRCHRCFPLEMGAMREVTARVMAVHRPIFLERAGFRNLAGVVTATPRAMPPPCHVR